MNPALLFRFLVVLLALGLAGCGNDQCTVVSINVNPQAAAADHTAAPPANAEAFLAFGGTTGNCVTPAEIPAGSLHDVTWSVSDPVNVSISNDQDATYGVATCIGATSGPVTVTAILPPDKNHGKTVSGSGQLTCN